MFSIHCPVRGVRVLIWPSQVRGVTPAEDGLELHFRCDCGQASVLVTGRDARGEALHHPAPLAQPTAV